MSRRRETGELYWLFWWSGGCSTGTSTLVPELGIQYRNQTLGSGTAGRVPVPTLGYRYPREGKLPRAAACFFLSEGQFGLITLRYLGALYRDPSTLYRWLLLQHLGLVCDQERARKKHREGEEEGMEVEISLVLGLGCEQHKAPGLVI